MLKKLMLAIVAVLLLVLVVGAWVVWRHPLQVAAWYNRRQLARAGFLKQQLSTPAGTLTYFEAGHGPTLVLLHGAGDNAGTWARVAPQFTVRFHILIPDLPGHGESQPHSGPLRMSTLLDGVGALIAQRGGDQPVILAGNSLGAWAATLYAQQHPQRVARLVLVNGAAMRGSRPYTILLPNTREQAAALFDLLMDPGSPRLPGFVLDDVIRQSHNGPVARLLSREADLESWLLDGRMSEVKTPTDIIWGSADRLLPLEYAERVQAAMPAARLIEIKRCGHVPQQECPRTLTTVLQRVLAQAAPQPGLSAQAAAQGETR